MKNNLTKSQAILATAISFLLIVLLGCATDKSAKNDLKSKSDNMFNEMEKDVDSRLRGNDSKNEMLKQVQHDNSVYNEIEFEEIGIGEASKFERTIDAEKRAEEDALSKVLKKAGTDIYYGFEDTLAQYGKTQYQFVARYLYTWQSGITKYEKVEEPQFATTESGGTKCTIRLKGKIISKGKSDPMYEIRIDNKMGLDKQIYSSGDEVKLSFSVSKDSYITILNVDEEQNVYLVYPNKFVRAGFVKAGVQFEIPGDSGINLKAVLPEGRNETLELLHIIASKKEHLFSAEESREKLLGNDSLFALGDLKRVTERFAKLDRDEWTMLVLPYSIINPR